MNAIKRLKIQMRRCPEVFDEPSGTACANCGTMTTIGQDKLGCLKYQKPLCRLCLATEHIRNPEVNKQD